MDGPTNRERVLPGPQSSRWETVGPKCGSPPPVAAAKLFEEYRRTHDLELRKLKAEAFQRIPDCIVGNNDFGQAVGC